MYVCMYDNGLHSSKQDRLAHLIKMRLETQLQQCHMSAVEINSSSICYKFLIIQSLSFSSEVLHMRNQLFVTDQNRCSSAPL